MFRKIRKRLVTSPQALRISKLPHTGNSWVDAKEKGVYISNENLIEYMNVRSLESLTDKWIYSIRLKLEAYLDFSNNRVSRNKTIEYLKLLQARYSQATYRKHMLQIRRFLRYMNLDYMENIKIVPEPDYQTARLEENFIKVALEYFKEDRQFRAIIMLGAYTGMRPSELFRLEIDDIDLIQNRILIKKSKTGKQRYVFFNDEVKRVLKRYINAYKKDNSLKYLFGECRISRAFRNSPIRIKQLRKYFIQAWHRQKGSYPIGEILLGHSTRSNVSLKHYLRFSLDEIKEEYMRVFN